MAKIMRKSHALWKGGLKEGTGTITSASRALNETAYSFETRFEDEPGTNPEELIAAAHAGCFSMALANTLKQEGYDPERVLTVATTVLKKSDKGFAITEMHLEISASVPDLEEPEFDQLVEQADQGCPVSNLLRNCLKISIDKTTLYT
jgi:osmotically inducible protein OsmC